jgi:hypothetical protein
MSLNANQIPIYTITPVTSVAVLNATSAGTYAATTNAVIGCTAGANGAVIDSVIASSNDTAAINLNMMIVDSGGNNPRWIGQINVPITAGSVASTLAVDCLLSTVSVGLPRDNNGKTIIRLAPSETLRFSPVATMTAAKTCQIAIQYSNF